MTGVPFLRWALVITVFVICTGGGAYAASGMDTNATVEEMRLWGLAMAGSGLVLFIGFTLHGHALFAALGALFLLGSSARLWMTQPLWFPKLEISADTGTLVMLAILGGQAALTGYVFMTRWPEGATEVVRRFGRARILLLLLFVAVFSVSPTNYVAYGNYTPYLLQIIVGGAISAMQLATLVAMFLVAGPVYRLRLSPFALGLFACLVSALLAWFAFDRMPHVEDEVAYLFQARTFAGGAITVPAPPPEAQAALEYYLLDIRGDRWLSTVAPGWPAILSLGVLLGFPWLINPILTGVSVYLAHGIVRRTVGEARAGIVSLLMATSPWVLAIGASMMTHAAALFMALFGWWCLVQPVAIRSRAGILLALCAGLAMGWLFTTRPLEGVLIGVLTWLWLLRSLSDNKGRIAAYSFGCVLTGSVFLAFNYTVTGDLLLTPQADYLNRLWPGAGNTFGFGPDVGPPAGHWLALDIWPGHSPAEGLLNTLNGLASMNFEFLGWTFGSLIALWSALLWFRQSTGFDKAMLLVMSVVIGTMFFYWFTGTFFIGPRYWYIALLPFLTLSAAGILEVRRRLPDAAYDRLPAILIIVCAVSIFSFTSWRGMAKYHDYLNYTSEIRDLEERETLTNALVIISTTGDIGLAFYRLDPFLSPNRPVYVRDLGPEANAATIAAFSGRKVVHFSVSE